MLHVYHWNAQELITKYKENASEVLVMCRVKSAAGGAPNLNTGGACAVCANVPAQARRSALACQHSFCNDCWAMHFEVQIMQGRLNYARHYVCHLS